MKPLRVAFFGLPLAATLLLHDGHDLVLAAVCRRDAPGKRRLLRLVGRERFELKPNPQDPAFIAKIRALQPDLVVSWFWTTRLPVAVMQAARHGGIGVHPSLLPRHRGPDPTFWAISSGDTETGVTVHELAEDYDTGSIIAARRLTIEPTWNAWQLAKALDRPSLALLRETVARYARGDIPAKTPQDEALATEAPTIDEEACAILWSWPVERVLRHVRALAPAPGAWTEIDGACVVVTRAAAVSETPAALLPGEAAVIDGRAVVRAGDGGVLLLEGEIDGEAADADALAALVGSRGLI